MMTQSAYANVVSGDASAAGPFKGARTLVIEDSAILATEIVELLAELGCRVVGPVATTAGVRRILETEDVDAAIVDINLNGLRTFEPAGLLAARGIPFVFVSGYSETSVPAEFETTRFLRKPVDPAELAEAVGEAVQSSIEHRRSRFTAV